MSIRRQAIVYGMCVLMNVLVGAINIYFALTYNHFNYFYVPLNFGMAIVLGVIATKSVRTQVRARELANG